MRGRTILLRRLDEAPIQDIKTTKRASRLLRSLFELSFGLTFEGSRGILYVIPQGRYQGHNETLAQGERPCIGYSERRIYDANEETNTPFRDGISD